MSKLCVYNFLEGMMRGQKTRATPHRGPYPSRGKSAWDINCPCAIFTANAYHGNVWPWKWRSKSWSIGFAMTLFDCNFYKTQLAYLRRLSVGMESAFWQCQDRHKTATLSWNFQETCKDSFVLRVAQYLTFFAWLEPSSLAMPTPTVLYKSSYYY